MSRSETIGEMTRTVYDMAIIGGGIYGASVARDASLRGLKVILLDKGDFGSATSANSHKIIHGGLRYLQHGDLKRMRESIQERSTLMRIAPHLVYPMPFLIPTYRSWSQGKVLMWFALKLNDLIGFDRNRWLSSERILPNGRVITKLECLKLCPGLDAQGLTGGALFYDAQVYNPERLILSILFSASESGARLLNYAQVKKIFRGSGDITDMKVQDVLAKKVVGVRSRLVINCSGPWVGEMLSESMPGRPSHGSLMLKAVVLVTRSLSKSVAVGVSGKFQYKDEDAIIKKGHRYFFITPWRNRSLIGTFQGPYDGPINDCEVTDRDIEELLVEINRALPGANLVREDVYFVNRGLLPRSGLSEKNGEVQVEKHYQIHDHSKKDRIDGLISVIGVKFTTARDVAEKVVSLAQKKLGVALLRSQTDKLPVVGGDIEGIDNFVRRAKAEVGQEVDSTVLQHLVQTYGSRFKDLLRYGQETPSWFERICQQAPVIKAEVIHAVREEMAQKLGDVIFRRTDLGTAGYPGDECLMVCAEIMAGELGWSVHRMEEEIEEVKAVYSRRRVSQWGLRSETYVS